MTCLFNLTHSGKNYIQKERLKSYMLGETLALSRCNLSQAPYLFSACKMEPGCSSTRLIYAARLY